MPTASCSVDRRTVDVVIKDFGVSRRHAEVVIAGEDCRLVDLESKNGTQVNGVRVLDAILNDGDQILLGKFLVQFRKTLDEQVVLDEEKPMLEEAGTVIRSVGELSKLLLEEGKPDKPTNARKSRRSGRPRRRVGRAHQQDESHSAQLVRAREGPDLGSARGSPGPCHGCRFRAYPRRPRFS